MVFVLTVSFASKGVFKYGGLSEPVNFKINRSVLGLINIPKNSVSVADFMIKFDSGKLSPQTRWSRGILWCRVFEC
jgi:hypothetical protein